MSEFQIDLIPSFCNNWPEIAIEINGKELWRNHVDHAQTVNVAFEVQPTNCLYVRYLNKLSGPTEWDTQVDLVGNIIADQNCVIRNFYLARSRCDFLLHQLNYHRESGIVEKAPWGFMSHRGYYKFEFPQDIYGWIIKNRVSLLTNTQKRNSSLDYWNNYLAVSDHTKTQDLLKEINNLLDLLK